MWMMMRRMLRRLHGRGRGKSCARLALRESAQRLSTHLRLFYKRLATTNSSEVARKRPWQELRTVGATTESIIR